MKYKTIKDIRWENGRHLLAMQGLDLHDLSAVLDKEYSYVHNILCDHPIKNIGNRVARQIELSLGVSEGWLDYPHMDKACVQLVPVSTIAGEDAGMIEWFDNEHIIFDGKGVAGVPRKVFIVCDDKPVVGGDIVLSTEPGQVFEYHYTRDGYLHGEILDDNGTRIVIPADGRLLHVKAFLPSNR